MLFALLGDMVLLLLLRLAQWLGTMPVSLYWNTLNATKNLYVYTFTASYYRKQKSALFLQLIIEYTIYLSIDMGRDNCT